VVASLLLAATWSDTDTEKYNQRKCGLGPQT
jgi:hypothetical protein